MGKKKESRQVVNIQEMNLEIDYDKLAEALIKAQGKQATQYSVTREWMKTLIIPMLWGIAIIAGLLGVIFACQGGKIFAEALQKSAEEGVTDACMGSAGFIMGLFFIMVAILAGASAKEVDKEKDKNFVVEVFSGIVSLVALIISFIALLKEVG